MGQSEAVGVDSSDDVLRSVEAFIEEHIGSEPFPLLGESYGGYIARALAASRAHQVRGLALICPIGSAVENADRKVPEHQVLVSEIDIAPDAPFAEIAVAQTQETIDRTQREVVAGLMCANATALERIRTRWALIKDPESGPPFEWPTLLAGATEPPDSGSGHRQLLHGCHQRSVMGRLGGLEARSGTRKCFAHGPPRPVVLAVVAREVSARSRDMIACSSRESSPTTPRQNDWRNPWSERLQA